MNITQQIEIELKKYFEAFNNRNWGKFGSHLNEDFTYFTDNCIIQNKEKFVDYLSKNPWSGRGYKISDLTVSDSTDESLAVARYKAEFTGFESGKKIIVYAIETTIFAKRNNDWKIVHSHTSNKM
ncbi:MAG: nuclear transport factor 2 family protein [Chlorobi bacterium]|nr:nuclear transport factor 2 family protein [Chlorobiota bacterium]MCI0716285.1 nuclear transport factor 2 family protein [Chlorobiota bacterium]